MNSIENSKKRIEILMSALENLQKMTVADNYIARESYISDLCLLSRQIRQEEQYLQSISGGHAS